MNMKQNLNNFYYGNNIGFISHTILCTTNTYNTEKNCNTVFQLPVTEVHYSQYYKLQLQYSMVKFAAMS